MFGTNNHYIQDDGCGQSNICALWPANSGENTVLHCNAVVRNMHGTTILNMQGIPLLLQQKHKFTVFIVATATINFSLA